MHRWPIVSLQGFAGAGTACALLLHGAMLFAGDAWVIRGVTRVPADPGPSLITVWNADVVLHNTNAADASVTVEDVSNGGVANHAVVTVPARSATMLGAAAQDNPLTTEVWIDHLDVPPGVIVEGRLEYRFEDSTTRPQPEAPLGKVSTPVTYELTPAGVPKLHPGTDLGVQDVRVNVGIYNAAEVFATAVIEVRRSLCTGLAPVTHIVSVPPRSLVQTSVFDPPLPCGGASYDMTTTVTVDQPSLSYAVALSNSERPNVTFGFGR